MLFNIAAKLLSLANACGVFQAFIDGEMWSFDSKFILNKFQVSPPFRFQDIALWNLLFFN